MSEAERSVSRPGFILRLAVVMGLATGLGEVVLFWAQRYLLHRFIFVGRDLIWMAPTAELLVFLVLALPILLIRAVAPRLGWKSVLGFYGFVSATALLWMYTPLHKAAALVLALGLAVQLVRIAGRHLEGYLRVVRRGVPVLLIVTLVVGAGSRAVRWWQERQSIAALPPAGRMPNVLLIILDTVRAWNLSGYGYDRPTTPNLDRLMADGVKFNWAFSQAPWTLPSHASLFTARFPHELQADWLAPLDSEYPTLAEAMAARGYLTAGFVGNTLYGDWEKGLHRGFQHYEDFPMTVSEWLRNSVLVRELSGKRWLREPFDSYQTLGRKSAAMVNREFLDWLGRGKDRPFFVFLNYFDVHAPYLPADSVARRFATPGLQFPWSPWTRYRGRPDGDTLPRDYVLDNRDRYDAALAEMDREIGRLMDSLRTRGLLDSTVVVVTADHGEQFGEHGLMGHGNSLYLPLLHVPLFIRYPGQVPAGRVVTHPVGLRDIAATIADLTATGQDFPLPGRSLARFWSGDSAPPAGSDTLVMEVEYNERLPKGTPVDKGTMRAVVIDSLHYILNGDRREELYQYPVDSLERRDLAPAPESRDALERHRGALRAIVPARKLDHP